jgi:hypothetical protein
MALRTPAPLSLSEALPASLVVLPKTPIMIVARIPRMITTIRISTRVKALF